MPSRKSAKPQKKHWLVENLVVIVIGFILFLGLVGAVNAYVRVRGYWRNNGTYVQPHYRSDPNPYKWDNYSSSGNTNPWTGQRGYKKWWQW